MPSSGHEVVLGPELPSQPRQLAGKRPPLRTGFGFSCLGDFVSSFSSPVVHADVAASSTHLATIVLHLLALGLSRRGFALESAAARICREAGGSCEDERTRDLDVQGANPGDGRRLRCVQLAVDTTLLCALHGDGRPRRGAAEMDGVAILAARRAEERRCPEFVGVQARARLVVLAVEVGGGWFLTETCGFLTGLAKARARSETPFMQRRVEQAWRMRWSWLLGCAAAKAVAASLLEMQGCVVTDGDISSGA